jgi:hypothetical protein
MVLDVWQRTLMDADLGKYLSMANAYALLTDFCVLSFKNTEL